MRLVAWQRLVAHRRDLRGAILPPMWLQSALPCPQRHIDAARRQQAPHHDAIAFGGAVQQGDRQSHRWLVQRPTLRPRLHQRLLAAQAIPHRFSGKPQLKRDALVPPARVRLPQQVDFLDLVRLDHRHLRYAGCLILSADCQPEPPGGLSRWVSFEGARWVIDTSG